MNKKSTYLPLNTFWMPEPLDNTEYGKLHPVISNSKSEYEIIFIPGFTKGQKSKRVVERLLKCFEDYFNNTNIYFFSWDSGKIAKFFYSDISETIYKKLLIYTFSKSLLKFVPFSQYIPIISIIDLARQWRKAKNNSDHYSHNLISEINCNFKSNSKIILIGHSLGCRLIYYALKNSHDLSSKLFKIYLCGGAVDTDEAWDGLLYGNTCIVNNWSHDDLILKILYKYAEMLSEPIGIKEITGIPEIKNIDLTGHINGHSKYFYNKHALNLWFDL